jgi:hypothetical protein
MFKLKIISVILLMTLLSFSLLQGAFKPEIQAIIDNYEQGDTSLCASMLQSALPANPDENAVVLYYKAMLGNDAEAAKANLLSLLSSYPKTSYAQKAMLELGNLCLLDRDYDKALGYYRNITDPDLVDKHYWIANTYYQMSDYQNAIASGNQYIRLAKRNPRVEDIFYLVADSYFSLAQYNNTISTLKKLLSQPDSIDDEQYLRYRYGYACEMLGNRLEAISQYKQGIEKDRFSSLAYLIEDRLFEMRERFGNSLDLSFLYPYSDNPLPDIVIAEQLKAEEEAEQDKQDSTAVEKETKPKQLDAAPEQGLFLQAGRFSQEKNADKLCEQIIKYGLTAQFYKSAQFKDISWVVVVGPYQTQQEAQAAKDTLKDNNIDTFIIER